MPDFPIIFPRGVLPHARGEGAPAGGGRGGCVARPALPSDRRTAAVRRRARCQFERARAFSRACEARFPRAPDACAPAPCEPPQRARPRSPAAPHFRAATGRWWWAFVVDSASAWCPIDCFFAHGVLLLRIRSRNSYCYKSFRCIEKCHITDVDIWGKSMGNSRCRDLYIFIVRTRYCFALHYRNISCFWHVLHFVCRPFRRSVAQFVRIKHKKTLYTKRASGKSMASSYGER